jgi:hypothetical protein
MKPMNRPVRPPTLPRALDTPLAAPAIAGPAALVTRERPSAALAAVSFAASVAFWVAVDSNRTAMRVGSMEVDLVLKAEDRMIERAVGRDILDGEKRVAVVDGRRAALSEGQNGQSRNG